MQIDDASKNNIGKIIYEHCKKYIPRKSGKLADDVTISGEEVKFNQAYAKKIYFNHTDGKYWDKRAMADDKEEILGKIKRNIKWVNR